VATKIGIRRALNIFKKSESKERENNGGTFKNRLRRSQEFDGNVF
jgi:hypothetical protein